MSSRRIVIIGCGLTGPVLGMYLARCGYTIAMYERGPDPRQQPPRMGKSINITLTERGLHALAELGLRERVQRAAVPVYGRMVHQLDGCIEYQPYGNFGEALWSIERSELNRLLVEAASAEPALDIRFEHPCRSLDLESRHAAFCNTRTGAEIRESASTFIGADGAHSIVRQYLQRRPRFQYSQHYASYANKELHVPSDSGAPWAQQHNVLHIWPRGDHMLISFPNADGSVTCSLHMPYDGSISYRSIQTGEQLRSLFAKDFADALPYIARLEESYLNHPLIPLLTIHCAPWSWEDRALLIGDAAHAILPSYGQGANCCFEDCAALAACITQHPDDRISAFNEFEQIRLPNTEAISRLSEDHFCEIREHAGDAQFQRRKRIELRLNRANPEFFRSTYSLVSFSRTPYSEALHHQQRFDSIVSYILTRPESEHEDVINRLANSTQRYHDIIGG